MIGYSFGEKIYAGIKASNAAGARYIPVFAIFLKQDGPERWHADSSPLGIFIPFTPSTSGGVTDLVQVLFYPTVGLRERPLDAPHKTPLHLTIFPWQTATVSADSKYIFHSYLI